MTTESVDIQVQGTVKPKIETDLRGIAKAASDGSTAIQRLQQMLNQLDSGGLSGVQNAIGSATSQIEKQTRAFQDAAASSRMQAANLRVLQSQLDKTASAQQAVATATKTSSDRMLEIARAGMDAAQAERTKAAAFFEATRAITAEGVATQRQTQFTQEQILAAQAATRAARDKIAATNAAAIAEQNLQTAQKKSVLGWQDYNAGLAKTGQNAQLARHHMLNLGFQLQDIGVSLASGQNPLTVAIQQGAQIQGIAQQANVGLRGLAVGVGRLLAPMLPFALAIGGVVAGLKIMSGELSKSAELEKYSKSLGLTAKQIEKLDGDVVTITDTFKAFFTTVSEVTGFGTAFDSFVSGAEKAFKNTVGFAVDAFNVIGALSSATAQTFLTAWDKLPVGFRNVFITMYNSAVGILEALVNFSIAAVNQIITGFNKISTIKVDLIAAMPFERMDFAKEGPDAKGMADTFMDTFKSSFDARNKEFADFYAKWQKNSVDAAKSRIKESAEKLGGKGSSAEETRAAAMAKLNAQLDNELSRLTMLKPIREQQQRFDQIEEQLLGRKIKLTDAEAASIKNRIDAIAEGVKVQQQADRIYEETTQASEAYNSTLAAAQQLLDQGAISQDVYNAKTDAAADAYENALDPLRKYREEMQFLQTTAGMTSAQLDIATQRRQIEQEALRSGTALRKEDVDALTQQAEAAQYAQGVQQQYNQIWNEAGGALETVGQKMQALQMAYANGLIGITAFNAGMVQSQIEAAKLRVAMDQAMPGDMWTASFAQVMDGYQGMIAGVTDALGNMLNTMVDGFSNAIAGVITGTQSLDEALRNVAQQALQMLISSLIKLGIQWALNAALAATLGSATTAASIGMAGATAAAWAPAAAAVSLATLGANSGPAMAGISSTFGLSQGLALAGFQEGGFTGTGGKSSVAGLVHGQEFVAHADATAKYRPYLEAMNNGTFTPTASTQYVGSRQPKISIVNTGTPQNMEVQSWTEDEIRLIASDQADQQINQNASKAVARDLGNPNSSVSRSMGNHTLTKRRRNG